LWTEKKGKGNYIDLPSTELKLIIPNCESERLRGMANRRFANILLIVYYITLFGF